MSFKDSKAQILANSASDDSDISTIKADLATTAVVDDGYVLCTDGRYVIYDEYYDNSYSTVDKLKNVTVDSSQINIVQETNSQYIPFRIPRYWDGIDLMKMLIQIRYENVSTKKGQVLKVRSPTSHPVFQHQTFMHGLKLHLNQVIHGEKLQVNLQHSLRVVIIIVI